MELQNLLKKKFNKVINFKPKSSRSDSSEKYVVALKFKKNNYISTNLFIKYNGFKSYEVRKCYHI